MHEEFLRQMFLSFFG